MTLESEVVTADTGPSPELVDMRRRFWIGLVLTLPVLVLEMGGHLTNLHMLLGPQMSNGIQPVLARRMAATLERASEHPLAAAIVESAMERGLALGNADDFDSPVGKGVTGSVEDRKLIIGSHRIMEESGVDVSALTREAEALRGEGATVIFVAVDGRVSGLFAISDSIKATPPEAVQKLLNEGVRVVMLTGDNKNTATARVPTKWGRWPWA